MLSAIRAIGSILVGIVAKLLGPFGWLASIIVQPIIDWAVGAESKREAAVSAHDSQVAQAAQDTAKLDHLTPDSAAKETEDAIDDTLKHL